MEQVFIANPKGGCGKTTIAAQLAGHYAMAGRRVLLADHDAQKSSSDWVNVRPGACPKIFSIVSQPDEVLDSKGMDIVIHDMPAAWTLAKVEHVVREHDHILIPVLSSPTDIRACFRFIMTLHREGVFEWPVEIGIIANRARTYTKYYQVLSEFIERLDIPLVGTIRDTQNYVRAMDRGLSLFDLPPSRAQRDIENWQPVIHWLEH